MRSKYVPFCAFVLTACGAGEAQAPPPSDLVVHEWGTFLAMNGSDGAALDGMYHEEHALPAFVHARSRDQLRLRASTLKGETPVIYFYTKKQQDVRVTVRFPQGVWTQWYPQAATVGPNFAQVGSHLHPRNGRIAWYAKVIPDRGGRPAPALPKAASAAAPGAADGDVLWNYARDVDAACVSTTDRTTGGERTESERFLFYRGLGRAATPLGFTSADGGTLSVGPDSPHGMRHLFVLRVENGKGVYRYLPALPPGQRLTGVIPAMTEAEPLSGFTKRIARDLAARLTASGLYPKEAWAMVNTWRASYFRTEGVRVLYVLPQAWTDAFIPLEIAPRPKKVVRVMVGRNELLTPERERRFEAAVRALAAPDAAARAKAFAYLRDQGRYVEPILRRTLRASRDPEVRILCKRLLLTDFATELRAAVHSAADGSRTTDDPVHVRAQLASLLREVGLNEEARAEGQAVVAALQKRKAPPPTQDVARHYLRAYARAVEGLGDDRATAERYGDLIRFGSQIKNGCGGCHDGTSAPRAMAWFRDWYAGRKYAQYIAASGHIGEAIAACETTLRQHPDDAAAQMMLAYLYEEKGAKAEAAALWARIEGRLGKVAARPAATR